MDLGWRKRDVIEVLRAVRDAALSSQSECVVEDAGYLPPVFAARDADRWLTFAVGLWTSGSGQGARVRVRARYEDRNVASESAVVITVEADGPAQRAPISGECSAGLDMLIEELRVRGIDLSIDPARGIPSLKFKFRVHPRNTRHAFHRNAILLVEDDMLVRMACHAVLESAGYRVLECGQFKEALAHLEQMAWSLRLVIADVTLPDGDGQEFASMVHTQRANVPVLLMSGYTQPGTDGQPGTKFLAKPFNRESLMEAVRESLVSSHEYSVGVPSMQLRESGTPGTCA